MHKLWLASAACLLAACTSSAPTQMDAGAADVQTCPSDWPATCPDPNLHWTGQIDAIVLAKCAPCHNAQGPNPDLQFSADAYDLVKSIAKSVGGQVYSCRMPAAGGVPLTASERAALLGWIACGAPK